MIDIRKATEIVLQNTRPKKAIDMPLNKAAWHILAEDARSDMDLPPFDKSAMDGYAVISSDTEKAGAVLEALEELAAGQNPTRRINPGQCSKIMTGAPVPRGADAVIMVEKTEPAGDKWVRILEKVQSGDNICLMGEDMRRGDMAVPKGAVIRAQEAAILAATGSAIVKAAPLPEASIISTGNELVPYDHKPGPGSIRDCNSISIAARLSRIGVNTRFQGIAPDDLDALRHSIEEGLSSDILIVSGGVSMGDFDLVPEAMRKAGVNLLFEKVAIKPGRPTVFGTHGGSIVFGLPGNPVSSLVITELLVVPAVKAMMGYPDPRPLRLKAILTEMLKHKGDRDTFIPVRLYYADGWSAEPVEFHGSADIIGFSRGNALAILPSGIKRVEAKETVEVVPLGGAMT